MFFRPFGPFDMRELLNSESRNWQSDFWNQIENIRTGLSSANGVYVFSIKFGSKFTPWYVGKTCSSAGFRGEVLQGHKLDHYYKACDTKRGRPFLHLIARIEEDRGNFCKWSNRSERQIDQLETYLIGMALARNPELRNNKKTRFFRALDIEGVIGPRFEGRPREGARTLKNVFGLQI